MLAHTHIKGVVDVLGLRGGEANGYSKMWLSDKLGEGLPFSSLERVNRVVFNGDRQLAQYVVSQATYKRRRVDKKALNREDSQRLERVARVWTMAMDVYKNEQVAQSFLRRPHMMLHGKTPLEVAVANDVGASAVEGVLGRLKYGSAS